MSTPPTIIEPLVIWLSLFIVIVSKGIYELIILSFPIVNTPEDDIVTSPVIVLDVGLLLLFPTISWPEPKVINFDKVIVLSWILVVDTEFSPKIVFVIVPTSVV